MNEISGIPQHLMAANTPPVAKEAMGKDDFMKLLMAQIQNQDPLKPMDGQEFAAQLAQFSSLEKLTNIGTGIETLHSGFGEETKMQAVGMIGKRIQASGNEVELISGQPVALNNTLPSDSKPTKATIIDSGGRVVREITFSEKDGKTISWDGKDSDGMALPSGKYGARLYGVNSSGQSQTANADVSGLVTGVELVGKNAVLIVDTGSGGKSRVEMSKVSQVSIDPGTAAAVPGKKDDQLRAKAPERLVLPEAEAKAGTENEVEAEGELSRAEAQKAEMIPAESSESVADNRPSNFAEIPESFFANGSSRIPMESLKP